MRVTVDVKGEDTYEIDTDDLTTDPASIPEQSSLSSADTAEQPASSNDGDTEPHLTYADLLAAVDLSPHEVSVMVDGRPVPEDKPVDAEHVTVLRLIKGG